METPLLLDVTNKTVKSREIIYFLLIFCPGPTESQTSGPGATDVRRLVDTHEQGREDEDAAEASGVAGTAGAVATTAAATRQAEARVSGIRRVRAFTTAGCAAGRYVKGAAHEVYEGAAGATDCCRELRGGRARYGACRGRKISTRCRQVISYTYQRDCAAPY